MSLSPDLIAQSALAADARKASTPQALAGRIGAGQAQHKPVKAFGKILESLTPETAQQGDMSPEAQKTLAMQALNKRMSPGPGEGKKLREACEGFEAVFIGQMIKEMRKTVPKDGILDSKYEEQYVSMFDEELSKTLTKQGGIGLADFMEHQLATRASAKNSTPGPDSQKGLRITSSDRMAVNSSAKGLQNGLKDKTLNPLPSPGSLVGPDVTAVNATRPGILPGHNSQMPVAGNQASSSSGPLAGTPSQHLGMPGAQYLQGKDAELASGADLVTPVSGEVTSDFGWRKDPFTGQRAWHSGVDIAAPEGTPVKSCQDGSVVFSGKMHGYGNLVIVEHAGGVRSYYGHNKANAVTDGQTVKAGQVIAQVGQTGRATGPHLHFEMRVGGEAVDPAKLGGAMYAAASESGRIIPEL